jgi:hypothetical protein
VIKFVCEVPTAIDQRLFALGRVIQQGDANSEQDRFTTNKRSVARLAAPAAIPTGRLARSQPSVPSGYQATLG